MTDVAAETVWRDVAGAVLSERKRVGHVEPKYYLSFVSPQSGEVDTIPVTRGPASKTPLAWHIDITDDSYQVSPSIHSPGHYHSPNPVVFRRVGKLRDTMTDANEIPTTPAEPGPTEADKVLAGAEKAATDLLGQLRLNPGSNELSTVLGWLDSHGVLDAVDESANKPPAEPEAEAEGAPSETTPVAEAAAGEGTTSTASETPPAAAPTEPTASHAPVETAAAESSVPADPEAATTSPLKVALGKAVEALTEALGHL